MKEETPLWISVLLLALLLISISHDADAAAPPLGPGETVFWSKSGQKLYWDPPGLDGDPSEGLVSQAQERLPGCRTQNPDKYCQIQSWNDDPERRSEYQGSVQYAIRSHVRIVVKPSCDDLSHEGGVPTGTSCGTCAPGYIVTPAPYAPSSETAVSTGYECMRNREPKECQLLGKYEVEAVQGAFCVDQCAGIGDDGFCIDEVEKDPNEPQCSQDHPEYKGTVGYGGEAVLICGDPQDNCPSDHTWGVVEKGNTTVESCFPNAYNPPQCSGTDVLTKNQWGGFACLPLRKPGDNPDPGGDNDPNNGDSDGDGQGDINGITGQLQDIKKLLNRGNTHTDNINETLKGIGKQIQDGTKSITDAIGNIPGGGGGGGGSGNGDGDGEGDGEQDTPITWSGEAIDLKISDGLEQLNAVQGEYENLIANIRGEMAASFGSFTGGGGLEDNPVTLYGETFNAGLSKFGADLSIVGSIILFAASFIGVGIVMGAKD